MNVSAVSENAAHSKNRSADFFGAFPLKSPKGIHVSAVGYTAIAV